VGEELKFSLPNTVHCDENEVKKTFLVRNVAALNEVQKRKCAICTG